MSDLRLDTRTPVGFICDACECDNADKPKGEPCIVFHDDITDINTLLCRSCVERMMELFENHDNRKREQGDE